LRPPAERRVLAEEGRKVAVAVQQLQKPAAEHPNILITILGNLTREFSERLLHANEEISALE
jgi:glutaminase